MPVQELSCLNYMPLGFALGRDFPRLCQGPPVCPYTGHTLENVTEKLIKTEVRGCVQAEPVAVGERGAQRRDDNGQRRAPAEAAVGVGSLSSPCV